MDKSNKKTEIDNTNKIKKYLAKLGFKCISSPSAQNLIYAQDRDVIIIKNKKK